MSDNRCDPVSDANSEHVVHNHGAEEGPGLSCRETRAPDGSLRGDCLPPAQ